MTARFDVAQQSARPGSAFKIRASSVVLPVPGGPWIRDTVAQSGSLALPRSTARVASAASPPVAVRTVAAIQSSAPPPAAAAGDSSGGFSHVVSAPRYQ